MRLYIADDNIEFANFCAKIARSEGWTVTQCQDGAELLEQLGLEQGVALVLCDVSMPETDGIQVVQKLRDLDQPIMVRLMTGGLPVNALAAQLIGEPHGLIIGRTLYKPISIDELRASLAADNETIVKKFGSWTQR